MGKILSNSLGLSDTKQDSVKQQSAALSHPEIPGDSHEEQPNTLLNSALINEFDEDDEVYNLESSQGAAKSGYNDIFPSTSGFQQELKQVHQNSSNKDLSCQ